MLVASSESTSFSQVFNELDRFDPKMHMITTDLKVVDKRNFSTWLGRVFRPQKFNKQHVVNNLHKFILARGRRGSLGQMSEIGQRPRRNSLSQVGSWIKQLFTRTREGAETLAPQTKMEHAAQRTASLSNCRGLNHFFMKLHVGSTEAHKLEKLLNVHSMYLDVSPTARRTLDRKEQLKGHLANLDIMKPTVHGETAELLELAVRDITSELLSTVKDLPKYAAKLHNQILIVAEIKRVAKRRYRTPLDSIYSSLRDDYRLWSWGQPALYTDFKASLPQALREHIDGYVASMKSEY